MLNEVIEHVQNDAATLAEALRVTGPGGHVAIFAPNRFYPFETHGVYLGKRFIFGNIPFVNWLPDPLFSAFARTIAQPRALRWAVRNYWAVADSDLLTPVRAATPLPGVAAVA